MKKVLIVTHPATLAGACIGLTALAACLIIAIITLFLTVMIIIATLLGLCIAEGLRHLVFQRGVRRAHQRESIVEPAHEYNVSIQPTFTDTMKLPTMTTVKVACESVRYWTATAPLIREDMSDAEINEIIRLCGIKTRAKSRKGLLKVLGKHGLLKSQ